MRRIRSAGIMLLVVLLASLVVSSCALLPDGVMFDDSRQKADARMEQIVEALNSRDVVALKDMFSPYALDQAQDIDEGLEHLLSFFPNGGVTWEGGAVNSDGAFQSGQSSVLLKAYFEVTAGGSVYWLFFADSQPLSA